MTQTVAMPDDNALVYGDGSNKIFGMENFGNTCYLNSILQCLYNTDAFRRHLLLHNHTKHNAKTAVVGVKPHVFTSKYEQLVSRKLKEQKSGSNGPNADKARKGLIFGLKFNSSNGATSSVHSIDDRRAGYVMEARYCDALLVEQRARIAASADFGAINIMITRPATSLASDRDAEGRNDYSQSSSMLLTDQPEKLAQEGAIGTTSSAIIVGIPHPEPFLTTPINPFNANPSSDQRKRSALINGPIINLDTLLQLPSEQNDDLALLYALRDLFESMAENKLNIGVVSPSFFIHKLKEKNYLFRQNNMHHDAHEFFNYLINEIIETVAREVGPDNNWCNDIFQGLITNETKCLLCETVTSKHETFLDLLVDIPPGDGAYSLLHSLNNFSKLEVLTNQNKFYCNTCSSLQEAVKTIKVKTLPEVLVINFKRFKYDEGVGKMVKLFDSVSYPFNLRLFNTTDDDAAQFSLYELYGLVIHIGGGPMHGHYVSVCKVKAGLWLLFDDETVELVDDSYVMRFFGNGPGLASAYILFYSKSKTNDAGLGYNIDSVYSGADYLNSENLHNQHHHHHHHDTTKKLSVPDLDEEPEVQSETSSIASFTGPAPPPKEELAKKTSIFKTFKFDGLKDESLSRTNSTKEKKTWVGGLKKKTEPGTERKSSVSSASSGEKRKSIFGFKRK